MSSRIPRRGTGHAGRFNGPLRHTLMQWPNAQETDARIEKCTQIPGRHDESENGTTVAMRLSSLNSVMFFAVFLVFPFSVFLAFSLAPFFLFSVRFVVFVLFFGVFFAVFFGVFE